MSDRAFLTKFFDQFQKDYGLEQETIKDEDLALNSISVRAIKGLVHIRRLIKSLKKLSISLLGCG